MNRPMIYYTVSAILGCISSYVLFNNPIVGAVLAALFLFMGYFTIDSRYIMVVFLFFFIGMADFIIYFNVPYSKNMVKITVRTIQKKYNNITADYGNKEVILSGNLPQFNEGQKITVSGSFKDGKDYGRGIVGKFEVKNYSVCSDDFTYKLYKIRQNASKEFERELGLSKSSLVMSLCFGDASKLTNTQKNDFQTLGVIHAISVSGFHMAVIYQVLEKFAGIEISIIVSFIYVLFTGSQSSTMRSFIMIFIFKLSKKLYRNYDSLSSLAISCMTLILWKPYYFLDVGFVLSYLSTLGIILFYNKIRRILYILPEKLNETLSMSFSAQCFSMIYASIVFENFSIGFLLGNIFLLPFYTIVVLLGNIALLLIKFKFIFSMLNRLLYSVMVAIEGVTYVMMKISPPITHIPYSECIALILTFISFIMYKYGYEFYKYYPICMSIVVIFQIYSFFPEVNYFNFDGSDNIIVRYGSESTLITNYENDKKLINFKEENSVDRVITNIDGSCNIKICGKYIINVTNLKENNRYYINLTVPFARKVLIFTRDKQLLDKNNNFANCRDIIEIPKSNNSYDDCIRYDIIFGRAYKSF